MNIEEINEQDLYSEYGKIMVDYQIILGHKIAIENEINRRKSLPVNNKRDING